MYKPQQGSIVWKGESLMGLKPNQTAERGIARTFQNIELFAHMTVMENILSGRHIRMRHGWFAGALWWGRAKREEIENRFKVEDIIDFLEIERWRKYPVGLLPYGVQKRVELGRALAMDPELLLLDEPVAGMNLEETMGLVMDIADRVMVLDFGRKIAEGDPDEIQDNPEVISAYLGQVKEQTP